MLGEVSRCDVLWMETGRDTLKWAWANGGGGWYCVAGRCLLHFWPTNTPPRPPQTTYPLIHTTHTHTGLKPTAAIKRLRSANLLSTRQTPNPRRAFATLGSRPSRQRRWAGIGGHERWAQTA